MGKIGLAMSGGGARGVAHLGVLQALDEFGVEISALSGTSFGAIAGAFYASGIEPIEVLKILKKTKLLWFVRPAISKKGLFKVEKLQDLFSKYLPFSSFQDLPKKLTVNATDVNKGETKYFDQGALIPAILASSCMPVIFDPMVIDGTSYIDGGVLNNLPVEPLLDSCDKVLGSHCNPVDREFIVKNAKALLERTLLMAIRNNTLQREQQCDFYIEPPGLSKYIGSDFEKASEIYQIGYEYVIGKREELLKIIE